MTDVTRWDPFQEMTTLREAMNHLLSESFVRPQRGVSGVYVPLDLYETEHEYVASLAVPGLKPDDFEITMQQNVLSISGRTQPEQVEGAHYHMRERRYGDFTRALQFPTPINAENIQAHLSNGILTIHVPKSDTAKPRRITVKMN